MKKDGISRREFLKTATGVVTGGLLTGVLPLSCGVSEDKIKFTSVRKSGIEFRQLGRTGLKVTAVSMGVMNCSDHSVVRRAYDLGINFYDTAHSYQGGKNEVLLGESLKDVRDKVYIQTKVHKTEENKMMEMLNESLRRLQTEYVDVLLSHNLRSAEEVKNEEIIRFLQTAKKQGKARFIGFSTHSKMEECLKQAVALRVYDVILVAYNFKSGPGLKDAIAECARAGIGIVAMKTQAGGFNDSGLEGLTPHQAAIKWVLEDKNVACAVPGVRSIDQLEELFSVMGKKLTARDMKALEEYQRAYASQLCAMCGSCDGQC
ncbi:MAG: aldo/keto reductase, partial [Candidatus Sumerlaeia bacterium]|nr:aldo/keto reductase [Candidatus Sumerlaeia bacterium]